MYVYVCAYVRVWTVNEQATRLSKCVRACMCECVRSCVRERVNACARVRAWASVCYPHPGRPPGRPTWRWRTPAAPGRTAAIAMVTAAETAIAAPCPVQGAKHGTNGNATQSGVRRCTVHGDCGLLLFHHCAMCPQCHWLYCVLCVKCVMLTCVCVYLCLSTVYFALWTAYCVL
jgi:hypothetical protein